MFRVDAVVARDPAAVDQHRLVTLKPQRRHDLEAGASLDDAVVDEELAVGEVFAAGPHPPEKERPGIRDGTGQDHRRLTLAGFQRGLEPAFLLGAPSLPLAER